MHFNTFIQRVCLLLCCCASSCIELPDDVQVPDFAVGATIPLLDTTIQLKQFLGSNSTIVSDATSSNLSMVRSFDLPTIQLGDSLRIQSVAIQYVTSLNSETELVDRLCVLNDSHLGVEEIDPTLPQEGDRSIEPVNREVNIPFSMPQDIQTVTFDQGALVITVYNNLPVDIDLGTPQGSPGVGVQLVTPGQATFFAPLSGSRSHLTRRGTTTSSAEFQLPLTGLKLNSQSTVLMRVISSGTNGNLVHYTRDNNLTVSFKREGVSIRSAEASLAPQDLLLSFTASLPEGTQITDGIIEEFVADLQLNNEFPMAGNATLSFPQIISLNSHVPLSQNFRLEKHSTSVVHIVSNGERYRCSPDSLDRVHNAAMTQLHGTCRIHTDLSRDRDQFTSAQHLSVSGTVSPIRFSRVSGYSSGSTNLHISAVSDLGVNDFTGLHFEELTIQQVDLQLQMTNDADMNVGFEGRATLYDVGGKELASTVIQPLSLVSKATTSANVQWNDLHLSAMPARVRVDGNVRSLDNQPFTISKGNRIGGKATVNMPLSFSVRNGEYTNSQMLDLGNDIRSGMKRVQAADLFVEAHNTIPSDVLLTLVFYDSTSTEVLRIPRAPSMLLMASTNGVETKSFTHFRIENDDVTRLVAARRYDVKVGFTTDAKQSNHVHLKSTDGVRLKIGLQCSARTQ